MVLEAFAAIGLAGNIVQFVDYSCKLFSQSREIYNSTSGSSKDTESTIAITRNLRDLAGKLSSVNHQTTLRHSNDGSLKMLSQLCEGEAENLLAGLQGLQAQDPKSKWSSFKVGLATIWKQEKIQAMEQRLDYLRSQLILHLEVMQR
jgi:hypothetical protein